MCYNEPKTDYAFKKSDMAIIEFQNVVCKKAK